MCLRETETMREEEREREEASPLGKNEEETSKLFFVSFPMIYGNHISVLIY